MAKYMKNGRDKTLDRWQDFLWVNFTSQLNHHSLFNHKFCSINTNVKWNYCVNFKWCEIWCKSVVCCSYVNRGMIHLQNLRKYNISRNLHVRCTCMWWILTCTIMRCERVVCTISTFWDLKYYGIICSCRKNDYSIITISMLWNIKYYRYTLVP